LSCFDRVVVTGTLPGVCYAEGMTRFLYANKIRIFDYPQFAARLRDAVGARAAAVAMQALRYQLTQPHSPAGRLGRCHT
jgi:hypothetical protein